MTIQSTDSTEDLNREWETNFYSRHEELAHSITHGIGIALSLAGMLLLIYLAYWYGTRTQIVAFTIYGLSSLALYTASTFYHSVRHPRVKSFLRRLDHTAIYLLIAGSYTPFLLLKIEGVRGIILLVIIWTIALAGGLFKILAPDPARYEKWSLASYLAMGWIAVLIIRDMLTNVPTQGLILLAVGGVVYSLGVIFYNWESLAFNHAIWHLFVLGGGLFHFFAIFMLL